MPQPLAARLRPQTLDEFVGQTHLLGPGKVLRRLIESDQVSSMIFWGPPGVGKTSIIKRYVHQLFSQHYRATIGVDFEIERFEVAGTPFSLQM